MQIRTRTSRGALLLLPLLTVLHKLVRGHERLNDLPLLGWYKMWRNPLHHICKLWKHLLHVQLMLKVDNKRLNEADANRCWWGAVGWGPGKHQRLWCLLPSFLWCRLRPHSRRIERCCDSFMQRPGINLFAFFFHFSPVSA